MVGSSIASADGIEVFGVGTVVEIYVGLAVTTSYVGSADGTPVSFFVGLTVELITGGVDISSEGGVGEPVNFFVGEVVGNSVSASLGKVVGQLVVGLGKEVLG